MDRDESSEVNDQKQAVAGIFGRAASTYDQVGPQFFSYFGRRLVELAQIPPGAKVLDIATGKGAVLIPAAEAVGPRGTAMGIDLAREMVEQTRERVKELNLQNVDVLEMDAEHLEFPNESFDYVLCAFALFFFPRLDVALSEMRRVLKPEGRIAVTTWSPKDERWKWVNDLVGSYLSEGETEAEQPSDDQTDGQPVFNTSEGLEAILTSAGFMEVEIVTESKEFFYADEEQWWSNAWSHGFREPLEMIEEKKGQAGLKAFQEDTYRGLQTMKQPDGIPQLFSVLFGLATKR